MKKSQLSKLSSGKVAQLSNQEIQDLVNYVPNLSHQNFKKLNRAYMTGKGVRISLNQDELVGSGLMKNIKSGVKSGAKFVQNNKQLRKLKDKAIDTGINYAMDELGADEETRKIARRITKNVADNTLDNIASGKKIDVDPMSNIRKSAKYIQNDAELKNYKNKLINDGVNYGMDSIGVQDPQFRKLARSAGKAVVNDGLNNLSQGAGVGKNLRKGLKVGAKALKVGNKISNAMGYDDLQDMGIDIVANETIGRIDPTLGRIAGNAMKKVADKKIDKYAGSGANPYLPRKITGGSLSNHTHNLPMFDELKNTNMSKRVLSGGRLSSQTYNLPMFDRMKGLTGQGFKVYE